MEVIWVLAAVFIGWVLFRYFGGHGGTSIPRDKFGGLPAQGRVSVGGRDIGWTAADDGSFAAAWPIPSGHWIAIRASFDEPAELDEEDEEADLGKLDVTVAERPMERGIRWTDQIRDRSLRGDVEAVLKVLARIAKDTRSGKYAASAAKPVGTRGEIE